MIFPESELSTYLGFFVPTGQVEPLLDRIAEASSEFEELNLVGFLHLAQRELELTGDVNRDDAAVVLIEELQLPLADAAAVLEENPAATAARLQSAWAEVPDQHTGPLPNLLQDGLIMLEPGLELDESLVLDPSLSIITPKPATESRPAASQHAASQPAEPTPEAPVDSAPAEQESAEGAVPDPDLAYVAPGEVPAEPMDDSAAASLKSEAADTDPDTAYLGDSADLPDDGDFSEGEAELVDAEPEAEDDEADEEGWASDATDDQPVYDPMSPEDDEFDAWDATEDADAIAPDDLEVEDTPEVVVEVIPHEAPEPELVIAPEPEAEDEASDADAMVGVAAIEPEMVPGPAMAFAEDTEDVYEPLPAHDEAQAASDDPADAPISDTADEEPYTAPNPYAALSPESLEGSSQSFPWNPNDHGQPITAAALLALDDDPVLTQGPSQPITHVTGRIPVAEILDGETDAIAAFPSHHVASDVAFPTTVEAEADALASHLLDAHGRGDALVLADAPEIDDGSIAPSDLAYDQDLPSADPPHDVSAEPLLAFMDEDEDGNGIELMDAFGETGMPDQTPEPVGDDEYLVDEAMPDDQGSAHNGAGVTDEVSQDDAEPADGAVMGRHAPRKVITPYWMRSAQPEAPATAQGDEPEWTADDADALPGESTAQWGAEEIAEATWADGPFPQHDDEGDGAERDGEDTQQLPAMAMIAQIAAQNERAVIGANLAPDQAISPSVERFLDDLHGAWIAGGNDVLQRPVSDVPLGGRFELADPPGGQGVAPSPASVPPPSRPRPAASGADLTNDDAVEATYEEELVPEPPSPVPPPPAAVWIPGMADRAFRSTPWHQIADDAEDHADAGADLHGFGAAAFTPPTPAVRQSPAEKIQDADVAAFMAGGPADAPDWDGIDEGAWAHADYGPKRPKANRAGQAGGLFALILAAGVIYLFLSWPPIQSAITALGLPVPPLVVVGALAGVLGIGGLSMFIGSSIPKKPKVKVVRRRRRKRRDDDPAGVEDTLWDDDQGMTSGDGDEGSSDSSEDVLTDVWEEDSPTEI